jgi:hypothetical protein
MNAAFGVPGEEILMTGEELRKWEHGQATAALTALTTARRAFLAGILFTIAAAAVAFVVVPASNGIVVQVDSRSGVFCGELEVSEAGTMSITASDGTLHTIPMAEIRSIVPRTNC